MFANYHFANFSRSLFFVKINNLKVVPKPEVYSESCQTSKMELFAIIVGGG